ncbi:MAG: hypothetical protein HN775_07480 [Hellea sp.]|jgi:hypothetical protein|nr:hypothetical protein [Hellea sp.]
MNKKIWMYWNTGFKNAPKIVKKCAESWKHYNPNWEIIMLDASNIADYVDELPPKMEHVYNGQVVKVKSQAAFSDVLRIHLINKHGGLWVDATTACNKPLDCWLEAYTKTGFFAFADPRPTAKVASWFLYADKGNIIAEKWRKGVDAFWEAPVKRLQYFWFHDLFGEIYTKDTEFKTAWDKSLKYIANYDPIAESSVNPCWFVPYSPDRWKQIEPESLDGPCYKLTHGTSDVLMKSTSVMRLFNYESK